MCLSRHDEPPGQGQLPQAAVSNPDGVRTHVSLVAAWRAYDRELLKLLKDFVAAA
ncbi:MAG: hypothetical protein ACRD0V_10870 [Acidimicrobiales bacterium]